MMTTTDAYATTAVDTSDHSGVSWAAVFAGAAGAAALSLILILLGFGLGFSAVSPWPGDGATFKQMSVSTIIWLMLTQILASGLGGYIAGRLRVRWARLHDDEVYFRDTAHGFLAWAIATLVTATLVVGSLSGIVGGGLQAGTAAASSAAFASAGGTHRAEASSGYFIDMLFRDNRPVAVDNDAAHAIVTRIFLRGLADGQLTADDRTYLARVVAQRTEIGQAEAEQRIDQVFAAAQQAKLKAQQAADTARKVAAASALWMFVALLCGAFFASFLAIHGGRRRDAVVLLTNTRTLHATPSRPAH
ncbi:hypothetical protein N5J43_24555 [Pseudomonas nicosulfuronedens]|uniref:Transmembrane protein n=1 Tax=Pseudomonas nicosulfuronedens TaxID=2571105 RepID=A0A5R9QSL7_9PSED|nr:hypothetical protein [Pseudomonas nicosulfuronedens]MDH1011362.1 hypothetical protein [Pseudomonas nicosulfuronedens]MDH1982137.1 hypothetical protein [Pseudomonas nicosulfuronedens]MDH2029686.1 hypothetical protein [Pseudomonas nicosulfuronedens]TLX72962.1 hypothetical protein FAS41_22125 [Pseudomonas nicosulfuronedens]